MSRRWDAQGFTELAPVERMRVIDALCSNLSVLSASVTACVVSGAARRRAGGGHVRIQTRAQGVRVFIFHVCETCEKESKDDVAMGARKSRAGGQGEEETDE